MTTIKHIFKGESLSMLFAFPAEYDMARIQKHGVWIGGAEFTGVVIGQGIELKLTSLQTDLMSGNQRVSLWIDDTILGVRKPYVGDIAVGNTNALPDNESTSEVYDVIVNVDISVTSIEAGDLMFNYVKGDKGDPFTYDDFTPEQLEALQGIDGDSAYQIWLSLGNVGTEQDFIDSLAAGGIDLTAYLKTVDANNAYQPKGTYLENETDPTVPEWAKEASKPTYEVPEIIGLETALSGKVDNGRVLTDVPANAKFTDTIYTHPATHSIEEVSGLQTALDNKVDDSQVLTDVPANAKFTDTIYTHPANHPASIITQDENNRFVTDEEKSTWNAKQEALGFTAENVSNKKTTLTDSDTDYPTTKAVNTGLAEKADTIHEHDDRYYTESEVNVLLQAKKGAYDAEIVISPTTGTLTLKNSTETVLDGSLTDANVFTVALPTPTAGQVNESILIFKIGASLPTITQPTGIVWRGATPTLVVNTNWTIAYEQVNTTGTTFEIWAVATKNA